MAKMEQGPNGGGLKGSELMKAHPEVFNYLKEKVEPQLAELFGPEIEAKRYSAEELSSRVANFIALRAEQHKPIKTREDVDELAEQASFQQMLIDAAARRDQSLRE